jgi:hypothetical protein
MQLPASTASSPPPFAALAATTPLYRLGDTNRCPDCGQSQWIVGRIHVECATCETILPIATGRYFSGGQARA